MEKVYQKGLVVAVVQFKICIHWRFSTFYSSNTFKLCTSLYSNMEFGLLEMREKYLSLYAPLPVLFYSSVAAAVWITCRNLGSSNLLSVRSAIYSTDCNPCQRRLDTERLAASSYGKHFACYLTCLQLYSFLKYVYCYFHIYLSINGLAFSLICQTVLNSDCWRGRAVP